MLAGSATFGFVNEAVKKPTQTIDVVLAWDANRAESESCTHAHITLTPADQELLGLTDKPYLLHITDYDSRAPAYEGGEVLRIPLELTGFDTNPVGYTGQAFYAPEKYITRQPE